MFRLLRKLVGADAKDEARAALADAAQSLEEAKTQASTIQPVVERIKEHGLRNHFGERIEAAIRGA